MDDGGEWGKTGMWEDIEKICGNDSLGFDQLRVPTSHELIRQSGSNADHDLNGMPEDLNNVHLSRNVSRNLLHPYLLIIRAPISWTNA